MPPSNERIETIVSFEQRGEWPKALIAGYEPSAGNEYLFAALDRAIADLQARPERTEDHHHAAMTDNQSGRAVKAATGIYRSRA